MKEPLSQQTRHNGKSSFPWRDKNHFELLVDGDSFYPVILETIRNAQSHVLIEMYLVESGKLMDSIIDVLCKSARQGITVQLLFDSFGSAKLSRQDRQALNDAGVELIFYNPVNPLSFKHNLHRTHRKIIIIDGITAFTGGAGFTDSFIGKKAWRDTMIKINGEVVADWQKLFTDNVKHCRNAFQNKTPSRLGQADLEKPAMPARVIFSLGGTRVDLKRSFLQQIQQSRNLVWVSTAYFIPSMKIRAALRRAARNGVDVRLLLPELAGADHPAIVHASRRYYARLLRYGVRIYEYHGRFMHTKAALVDDWCTIGSCNMDRWNLLWNLEANQEIQNEQFARRFKNMFENDFEHSREIHYEEWKKRSILSRIQEWVWGKVDIWLTQFGANDLDKKV